MDSVFSPWLTSKFEADRPLIPIERITTALDSLENPIAEGITRATESATEHILSRNLDLPAINTLTWPVGASIQAGMAGMWRSAWDLGAAHGLEEMQAAIPEQAKRQAEAATFALDSKTLSLIAALLTQQPGLIIPIGVEQAILARVLTIAGSYSKGILDRLKGSLIAATIPQAGQPVLSRRELQQQIERTLNVAKVRAETIARTETTYAYNQARVQVFKQSSIVSHVRFLAIDDARTTDICRSRNGMLIPIGETSIIAANKPPLHFRCRSMLSPVMTAINPMHSQWAEDPDRAWDKRTLEPLPQGWRN